MSRPTQRSMNFTEEESERLMELCVRFRHIINCKKSDCQTVRLKEDTWKRIAIAYNAGLKDRFRDARSLKVRFINLKTSKNPIFGKYRESFEADYGIPVPMVNNEEQLKLKKEMDSEKESNANEEEDDEENDDLNEFPSTDDPLDAIESYINEEEKSLQEKATEQQQKPDADTINSPDNEFSTSSITSLCKTVITPNTFVKEESAAPFTKPPSNQTFQNKPFKRARRHIDQDVYERSDVCLELAEAKIQVVRDQGEQQRIQHNLSLKYAKAEFELKMQMMKEEHKLKKRKLELEILTLAKALKSQNNGEINH